MAFQAAQRQKLDEALRQLEQLPDDQGPRFLGASAAGQVGSSDEIGRVSVRLGHANSSHLDRSFVSDPVLGEQRAARGRSPSTAPAHWRTAAAGDLENPQLVPPVRLLRLLPLETNLPSVAGQQGQQHGDSAGSNNHEGLREEQGPQCHQDPLQKR